MQTVLQSVMGARRHPLVRHPSPPHSYPHSHSGPSQTQPTPSTVHLAWLPRKSVQLRHQGVEPARLFVILGWGRPTSPHGRQISKKRSRRLRERRQRCPPLCARSNLPGGEIAPARRERERVLRRRRCGRRWVGRAEDGAGSGRSRPNRRRRGGGGRGHVWRGPRPEQGKEKRLAIDWRRKAERGRPATRVDSVGLRAEASEERLVDGGSQLGRDGDGMGCDGAGWEAGCDWRLEMGQDGRRAGWYRRLTALAGRAGTGC
mgnify:CR=1 FL=1